jgi:hypothetical protein
MTGRFSRLRHPADGKLWSFARSLGCEKDLSTLRSEGVPFCDAGATLTVRPAAAKEDTAYQESNSAAQTGDLALVYLVGLDGWQTGGD